MSTLGEALREAEQRIDRSDARALLSHATGHDAAYLIAHSDAPLEQEQTYRTLVARREAGEPIAYVVGRREFFGRVFRVTPAVLIPRPETEYLVELALERIPVKEPVRVLDLGTGSGCIAITIALERAQARVIAVDRSHDALAIARENAAQLGVAIELIESDWYSAVTGQFDVVVANPPYVARGDPHLAQGDLRFEPRGALEAGAEGLDCIYEIVSGAAKHLKPGGWLLFEHGHDQAASARALLENAGYDAVFSSPDLAGIERITGGRLTLAGRSLKLMPDEFSRV